MPILAYKALYLSGYKNGKGLAGVLPVLKIGFKLIIVRDHSIIFENFKRIWRNRHGSE
jgi:hypothetical protein